VDRNQLIEEIRKQLQEEMKNLKNQVADQIPEDQRKKAQEVKDMATEFVKENPMASVGIAAVAGFLIARMLYKRGE
jgi:Uncharacterized conserved protein